ncbi:helix-turn-helix domain-containing protein [Thioalkalivibrio sp. ALE12]|uniref:helix-turn-helix domain-containing protein n=1 Tax=Thioalkalivibrio sp. ALE12 TaxID=1158170 RepID=UPI0003644340|nr:helix-turn-helix domain-containing protein [Thioalkalivibrio sp. ALE12]
MNRLVLKAAKQAGGQSALAKACGVKQQHVWNWIHRDSRVPAERCMAIERATEGAVTARQLRPDVFVGVDHNDAA